MNVLPGRKQNHEGLPPVVASALARLNSRWREDDVPRAERQALLQDVCADLVATHADTAGQDVGDLPGSNPKSLADEVVRERGVHRPGAAAAPCWCSPWSVRRWR